MTKLTFLKLDGLRGTSNAPRHIGDFEVSEFYTFSHQPVRRAGPAQLSEANFNYLQAYKRTDETSTLFKLAWTKGQKFASGELIVEELTAAGHLLRKTAFRMRSIVIDTVSSMRGEDTIGFKFESMQVVR